MAGMLSMADSLVIITAPSVDGASRAAKTLDWLDAHHYGNLVARAVVAVSHTRPRAQNVDMKVLDAHFSARCRALVHIPYDPHLVAGSVIRWTSRRRSTAVRTVACEIRLTRAINVSGSTTVSPAPCTAMYVLPSAGCPLNTPARYR